MPLQDADGIAHSEDPDQTVLLAVWPGSVLLAESCQSKNYFGIS